MSQQVEQEPPRQQDGQENAPANDKAAASSNQGKETKSVAEWVTFAISLVIILGLVAGVSILSLSNPSVPATFEIKTLKEEMRQAGEAYYLPLEVINHGTKTAEDVTVRLTLTAKDGKSEPEENEVTITLLAGGSTGDAVVVFKQDPTQGQLEATVVSYVKP